MKTGTFALASILSCLAALPASEALAQSKPQFTSGHADIVVEYNEEEGELEFLWRFEGAIVDGQEVGEDHDHEGEEEEEEEEHEEEHGGVEAPLGDTQLATGAVFVRPSGSEYDLVGVAAGESIFFLPQDEAEADALSAPFMGWEFEAPEGVFKNDSAQLRLISATSASGQPVNFAVWSVDGLSPEFAMSTADGITSADVMTIAAHRHYNVVFGDVANPGDLTLTFEVRAEKVNGDVLTEQFSLDATTCAGGSCAKAPQAAPALGGFGALALALGLGGSAAVSRRKRKDILGA